MIVGLFVLSLSCLSLFPLLQAMQKEGHSQYRRFLTLKMAEQQIQRMIQGGPRLLTSSDTLCRSGGVEYRLICKVIPEKNHLYRIFVEAGNALHPGDEKVSLATLYFPTHD